MWQGFSTDGNLKKKHSIIHTEYIPYPCSQCDKSLIENKDFINYMRADTNVTSHQWSMSGKAIITK